jgi:hypothetical protein
LNKASGIPAAHDPSLPKTTDGSEPLQRNRTRSVARHSNLWEKDEGVKASREAQLIPAVHKKTIDKLSTLWDNRLPWERIGSAERTQRGQRFAGGDGAPIRRRLSETAISGNKATETF